MKRIISLLTIILIIGFTSISFAGFDDYGYYRVNEKARVLQVEADGMSILWQWSKGVEYTGAAPPNTADWAAIPQSSGILFNYETAEDDDYLHLKKTYYTNEYNFPGGFHIRYLGDDPIGDGIMYMNVCHFKFSKNRGVELMPLFYPTQWKVFQAEKIIYMLTDIDPDPEIETFEYVYHSTVPMNMWLDEMPEEPYGFGIVDK